MPKASNRISISILFRKFDKKGLPAYTTAAGWLGYSEEKIVRLSKKFMAEGFTDFKIKVGSDVEDDIRRCRIMRHQIRFQNQYFDGNFKGYNWVREKVDGRCKPKMGSSTGLGFVQVVPQKNVVSVSILLEAIQIELQIKVGEFQKISSLMSTETLYVF